MTNTTQLTPEISSEEEKYQEEWKVVLSSKGEYTLSKHQALILKQAIASGNRATVMFDTFAIAIPYIVEFYRVRRFLKGVKQLPSRASELPYKPIPRKIFEDFLKNCYQKIGKKYENKG
jgi:hypothetical protein